MPGCQDGPRTARFRALPLTGHVDLAQLVSYGVSEVMAEAAEYAPRGDCVSWGIPFQIDGVIVLRDSPQTVEFAPTRAGWLVFMHMSDIRPIETNADGLSRRCAAMGG